MNELREYGRNSQRENRVPVTTRWLRVPAGMRAQDQGSIFCSGNVPWYVGVAPVPLFIQHHRHISEHKLQVGAVVSNIAIVDCNQYS